jgi:two-component system phosphate regulon sensor histidine kinase PhoR
MKRKILLLIIGCVITVAALACIQGYFIYNTYKLEAKEANAAITQQFLKLETSGKLDSVNNAWMKKTEHFINLYIQKRVTKDDYRQLIKKTSDSLSGIIAKHISKKGIFKEYEVNYSNYIVSAQLLGEDNKVTDTLFKGRQLLFGNNEENSPETQASQSTWRGNTSTNSNSNSFTNTDYEQLCTTGNECLYFEIVTERFYSIANWERQIIIKMSGLLGFSVLLLVFVVLLFYWSIKNLITQKKIADIKTDFINNITHEFQTPLAALDIAVMTLRKKDTTLTADQYANSLAIIERQNHRMQKLFRQVAEASVTADVINTDSTQVTGCAEIREIVADFSLSHPQITINCSIPDDAITINIDRFHLGTLLLNLLDNAVKYGAGRVDIHLEKSGDEVTLAVKDNGMGIAEKEQGSIFEKFYRIEKGNIHTTKGLGLGLFYAAQIVGAYKGCINVNSEVGKGATFIISIPRA